MEFLVPVMWKNVATTRREEIVARTRSGCEDGQWSVPPQDGF